MRYLLAFVCLLVGHHAIAAKNCKQPGPSWWDQGWAVTVYSGPLTSQTSSKIISDADFGDSGIIALAGSKKLGSVWCDQLDFEYEAQAVQHFGEQTHFEINPIVIVARWKDFPWNKSLPTTFAIGDGLSIATSTPKLEKKRRKDESAKTLNYVMAELTFSLPSEPQWAFVLRYHHRSGMFGVFHGVHDASTVLAAGLKYWF
jgi:hypothetical protein